MTAVARRQMPGIVEVKSKFEAEFRRFSLDLADCDSKDFLSKVRDLHQLGDADIVMHYTDPKDGDFLPINNDHNYKRALQQARPLLRIFIQRTENAKELSGTLSRGGKLPMFGEKQQVKMRTNISRPEEFRRVSAIIDVDRVPETQRRVKLIKSGPERPLGFYIKNGTSIRVAEDGVERVSGIFISRILPGGLAESTGLLAVDDEVLEVNGIEVAGKTLDQVTDMMIANSSNLIVTVKPKNQHLTLAAGRRRQKFSGDSTMTRSVPNLPEIREQPHLRESQLHDSSPDSDEEPDVVRTFIQSAHDTPSHTNGAISRTSDHMDQDEILSL